MEHVNTINGRQQLQQHQLEQQQQHNENQQQFCLRWHNHQTSLLSTLPVLLDQSHLTDVTISAEGRMLRAHRVVLSACSSFFMDIFRALEASNHPVIIIPGASFGAIVALLTFMYSGEVNVYEEQIPILLNLAETLGIKGLADVQNNNLPPKPAKSANTSHYVDHATEKPMEFERRSSTPTPPPSATPVLPGTSLNSPPSPANLLSNKLGGCTPLENFFLKSLQFYPNLLPQPLNFSQTALNKTSDLLAKYQQQCQLYQSSLPSTSESPSQSRNEDCFIAKRLKTTPICSNSNANSNSPQLQHQQPQQKDIKRIDKIVENLRVGNSISSKSPIECAASVASTPVTLTPQSMLHFSPQLPVKSSPNYTSSLCPQFYTKPPSYNANTPTASQQAHTHHNVTPYITPEDHAKLQQHIEQYAACQREAAAAAAAAAASGSVCSDSGATLVSAKSEPNLLSLTEKLSASTTPAKPPSNSKLYATCFICHKQLSNQYNLRVHLETHQNVRYACNVCSHVSRSKDALRKHVSYRHPGAPSPCENEARRKRVNKLAAQSSGAGAAAVLTHTATSGDAAFTNSSVDGLPTLSNNPYLFLPNQFNLAAAAAGVAVAESNTTPSAPVVAHKSPLGIKSETAEASNGDASEANASNS